MAETVSEGHRKKGNAIYRRLYCTCNNNNVEPEALRRGLREALVYYNLAMSTASNTEDKAAAAKNICVTSSKMHGFLIDHAKDDKMMGYYFSETMKYASAALNVGLHKPEAWRKHLIGVMEDSVDDWAEALGDLLSEERVEAMFPYIDRIPICKVTAQINTKLADALFKTAIKKKDSNDHISTLRFLKECYRPLETARSHCSPDEELLYQEIYNLQEDIFIELCVAESSQAIHTGNNLIGTALMDEETLNMDFIYDVIDWYQQAIILARGKDLENEAIANSHLGTIYKALNFDDKAKERFFQCVRLANSLEKNAFVFSNKDWFSTATEYVENYQRKIKEAEDREWANKRKTYVDQLKVELAELETLDKEGGNDTFHQEGLKKIYAYLEAVYKKFPPKNEKYKLLEVKFPKEPSSDPFDSPSSKVKANVKRALQKAVTHYHPDRQKEEDGMKWKVLAEEICKTFTRRYENAKGF